MDLYLQRIALLREYIEQEKYRGYDPYDALKSPLFRLPILRSHKWLRFATQQFVKRAPVNLRPLLAVPKGLNPVSLGLCIQAYAYLTEVYPEEREELLNKIWQLAKQLQSLIPEGFSGVCWGYDFDWEARYAKIPAYQPTVVATGIITNALFEAWLITREQVCADLLLGAVPFVLKDLNRTEYENSICFSYSPFDTQQVLNASLKGVRLLAQAHHIMGNNDWAEIATTGVRFALEQQREDGAWPYSLAATGAWVDNYHTGYVLDCLEAYHTYIDNQLVRPAMDSGFTYYQENLVDLDGAPKFYDKERYPIDCTAAGQMLLTAVRFNNLPLAETVMDWMLQNMQSSVGYFYFRQYAHFTNKTSFMRWSNAWMFTGLSYVAYAKRNTL